MMPVTHVAVAVALVYAEGLVEDGVPHASSQCVEVPKDANPLIPTRHFRINKTILNCGGLSTFMSAASNEGVEQWLPTSVQQESLRHAMPDFLVRGLFSLRLSNGKMTTANTAIATWCEWIKIILFFCHMGKNIFFRVPLNFDT